jgi:two-component system LytT family sensor kinase
MKKHFLLIIVLISLFAQIAKAQALIHNIKAAQQLRYAMGADTNDSWHVLSMKYNMQFWMKQHFVDSLAKRLGTTAITGYNGNATIARLNATKQVEFAVTDITPQTAGKYLYHVVLNDSVELVHWTKPTVFRSNKFATYAYLGKFECAGKVLKLEMYEVSNYKGMAVLTINCGYHPAPKINWVMVNYEGHYNAQNFRMGYYPVHSKKDISTYNQSHVYNNGVWQRKKISFVWSNEIDHIVLQMKNTLQNNLYNVYLKRTINNKTDELPISNIWQQTDYSPDPIMSINSSYFNQPGDYEIIIMSRDPGLTPDQDRGNSQRIPFTVLPGPITVSLKFFWLIILIILTTGGFMFMMYRDQQRRNLKRAAQNKQIATLQLQAVRSQLNPHFIFNALAGIQNLMNKNEVENANKYLSRFARITRSILDDGHKELTTVEQEVSLLTDYLQMEQMRFGFEFVIDVNSTQVDQQTEIPAMLLQPFIENAVKHGISALKLAGIITVGITKRGGDLILSVQDNGKGFTTGNTAGMGIKLCNERMALLNSIYKNSTILLHQTSGSKGTLITIELKNWL